MSIYNTLNKNKHWYVIIGIVLFLIGIGIDSFSEDKHNIWKTAISHFLLILGEALFVFFLVNVVLEKETKEKFLSDTKQVMQDQKSEIISSFSALSDELSKETNKLFSDINNDIFKILLQEKTSPEVAREINKVDFFKSEFLKMKTKMKYKFSLDTGNNDIIRLLLIDDFVIKNISKDNKEYNMRFLLTSTISKDYNFINAGYRNLTENQYKELTENDYEVKPLDNISSGTSWELKEPIIVGEGTNLDIYNTLETVFKINPDGIDDFFFTKHYMMPFELIVDAPNGYDFNLYPTFLEPIQRSIKRGTEITYEIPFLFPGQGFSFSLTKKA